MKAVKWIMEVLSMSFLMITLLVFFNLVFEPIYALILTLTLSVIQVKILSNMNNK